MSSTADTLAQLRQAHQAAATAATPAAATREELMGIEILPGARVLDTITGEQGVVLSGTVEHYVIPVAGAGAAPSAEGEA